MKTKRFIKIILGGLIISMMLNFSGCGGEKKTTGTFVIELYPEYAPKTVENFVKLVKDGFCDGLTFHRVYNGFMAQGGGYDTNDNKKPADSIVGEFASNGYDANTLSHTHGVISMARTGIPDSASSEFFICYENALSLDGDYAAFGKVIEGLEAVDALQEVEKKSGFSIDAVPTTPVKPIIIKKMTLLDSDSKNGENPKVKVEIEY